MVFADRPSFVEIPSGQQISCGGARKKKHRSVTACVLITHPLRLRWPSRDVRPTGIRMTTMTQRERRNTSDSRDEDGDQLVRDRTRPERAGENPSGELSAIIRVSQWSRTIIIMYLRDGKNGSAATTFHRRLATLAPPPVVNSAPVGHVWRRVRVVVERSHCPLEHCRFGYLLPLLITPPYRFDVVIVCSPCSRSFTVYCERFCSP